MRLDVDITLSEEDTATGTFVFAVSDQLAEAVGMDPQELWEEGADELRGDLPEGATEEPYAEDGYTGARYTFAEESIETFSGSGNELSITREDDEYVVTGVMDLTDESGDAEDVPQEVLDSFDVRVAVTFPGEVTESTGTIEGNTVVWRPPFGERTELSARGSAVATPAGAASPEGTAGNAEETTGAVPDDASTDDAGAGFPWWAVALAAAGLVLLALVIWLIVRANRPRAVEASPELGAQAPPQGDGQPPLGYVQPPPGSAQPPPPGYVQPPPGPPYVPPPTETPPDPDAPPSGEPRPPAPPQ